MRFTLVVNNYEAEGMGDESTLEDIQYEVEELLRSGYYQIESFEVLED